jgi:phospholipid transport system substrate-binding protein
MVGVVVGGAPASEKTRPEELVRKTTEEVLDKLEANKAALKEDPDKVAQFVEEYVMPHFDFQAMSQMVLAQNWRTATKEQRARFVEAFRQLLIHTYGSSLAEYSGERIEFRPMHSNPDSGRVTVSMRIHAGDGPPIPVDYKLYQRDDNPWQVFDVVVDGVSLVQNYRGSFAGEVKRKGLDALIERIQERNESRRPADESVLDKSQ